MNIRRATVGILLSSAGMAGGCSSQFVYDIGQAYQRGQCERMADEGGRSQCVGDTSANYNEYKRQAAGN